MNLLKEDAHDRPVTFQIGQRRSDEDRHAFRLRAVMSKSLDCVTAEIKSELQGAKAFETLNMTEPRVRSGIAENWLKSSMTHLGTGPPLSLMTMARSTLAISCPVEISRPPSVCNAVPQNGRLSSHSQARPQRPSELPSSTRFRHQTHPQGTQRYSRSPSPFWPRPNEIERIVAVRI